MRSYKTTAVILRRINYGEADRIITLLTADFGKIVLIAKGVRREKSKLAGGIELFSESEVGFIRGKGEMGTLVSTRMIRHFAHIHTAMEKLRVASQLLKRVDSLSEHDTPLELYDMVLDSMRFLNSAALPAQLVESWSMFRLLLLSGEVPNIELDSSGQRFSEERAYRFSFEDNRFIADEQGDVSPELIKLLRLLGREEPARLAGIHGVADLSAQAAHLLNLAYLYHHPE